MKLQRISSLWDRLNRNKINSNWERIETVFKNVDKLVIEGKLTPDEYAEIIASLNGLVKSGNVGKSDLTPEFKEEIEGFDAQLAQKVTKGNVTVADINKNLGKLDQTYLSDELLQQMAGNTPINAVPADGSITTKKLADKSVKREKLSDRFLFNGRIPVDNPIENVVNDGTYIVTGGNSGIFPEGESSASAWGMNVEVVNVNWVYQTIFKLDRPDIRYLRVKDNLNNIVYSWKKILFHSEENEKPNKNILMIGNSFSLNATKYVPNMCAEQGVDVTIGILYRSGESLENHLNNFNSNGAVYTYYERTAKDGVVNFTTQNNYTFNQVLEKKNWDMVTFQQNSGNSNNYETYQPFLNDLKTSVSAVLPNSVKYGALQTWALSKSVNPNQETAYSDIVSAYRNAMVDADLGFILPAGTAIQNARGIAEINAIDDELTDDGHHLGELGMYIASAAVFESLYRGDCSIEKTFYKVDGVTNYQRFVSSKVSQNAVNSPERITEL